MFQITVQLVSWQQPDRGGRASGDPRIWSGARVAQKKIAKRRTRYTVNFFLTD